MADSATLLSLSDHIHLVLIKTDPSGDTTLIGSHFLTWRDILSSANGRLACSVEINGVGAEAKVPMGILDIKFEIIPRLSQVNEYSSTAILVLTNFLRDVHVLHYDWLRAGQFITIFYLHCNASLGFP